MKDLRTRIESKYRSLFDGEPLCIFSPGRINLIGEHVDYNEGLVFPAAIDLGIFAAMGLAEKGSKVYALDLEECFEFSTDKITQQGLGSWKNYILGVVEEIKQTGRDVPNFHMVFGGNIPSGAGLSSSAALENCVAFGLNELFGLGIKREELIFISQRAEHNYAGVKCGIMDQFASMFGQKDRALLLDCRTMDHKAFELSLMDEELILINTNVQHSLAESAYNKRREVCEKTAEMLGITSLRDANLKNLEGIAGQLEKEEYDMAVYVVEEIDRVKLAAQYLDEGDLEAFGNLLFLTHEGLARKYKVSCEELDFLVELAKREDGLLGARLMGGGFGGCTINLVKKSKREPYIKKVREAYLQNFGKTCSVYEVKLGNGTRVIKPISI